MAVNTPLPAVTTSEPVSRRRNRKRTDVRGAILAVAVELFYRQGFSGTSVNEIVEEAGYTKGAFYHYFPSKQALLLEIHNEFVDYGITQGRNIVEGDHSPEEALRLLIRELLRQVGLYRAQMTIVLQEARYIPYDELPEAKQKRDDYEAIVVSIIERGINAKAFRGDLPSNRVISFGIMGMCVWAFQWLSAEGELPTDVIGEMYATIILDGLRATPLAG